MKPRPLFGRRALLGCALAVLSISSNAVLPGVAAQTPAQVTVGAGYSSSGETQFSIHAFSEYPQTGVAYLATGGSVRTIKLTCVSIQPGTGTTETYASGRDEFNQIWYLAVWDLGPTAGSDNWQYGQTPGQELCGYNSNAGYQTHRGEFTTTTDPTFLVGDAYATVTNDEPPGGPRADVTVGSGSTTSGDVQFSIHAFSEYPQTGIAYLAIGGLVRAIELTCVVVEPSGDGATTYASGQDDFDSTWHLSVRDFGSSSVVDSWTFSQSGGAGPCGYGNTSPGHSGEFVTRIDPTLLAGDVYATGHSARPIDEGVCSRFSNDLASAGDAAHAVVAEYGLPPAVPSDNIQVGNVYCFGRDPSIDVEPNGVPMPPAVLGIAVEDTTTGDVWLVIGLESDMTEMDWRTILEDHGWAGATRTAYGYTTNPIVVDELWSQLND